MDSLFGIPMDTIMIVLLVLLAACVATVLIVFLRNRIIFMMGLRNIPRRTAQTVLIVIGLMLSTIIITAAFTTGDTVDYSITSEAFDLLGHADVILDGEVASSVGGDESSDISAEEYAAFLAAADAAQLEDVDGYAGILYEPVPVINPETKLSEPSVFFSGVDASRMEAFPDVVDVDSGEVLDVSDLGPGEVYMNKSAADEIGAREGSVVQAFVYGEPHDFTVKAVVRDNGITGAADMADRHGMVSTLENTQALFGVDHVTIIVVSATGGVRDSLPYVDEVEAQLTELIRQNNLAVEVSDTKIELVNEAEQIGNFMTTFFLLLGLFSIGAGLLLIVMIFVMLAAERKSEMGMARAVGTKRLHLIEMFLAEGTGYNVMAAFAGVALGILVAFGIAEAASAIFATFGFTFTQHVTLRTVAISFSLGVVLTFVTIAFSSWRVSNLNIVRAIRDIPEPANRRMGWRGLAFWIVAIALGGLLFWAGLSADTAFWFGLGCSLISMGIAVLLTHFGAPARPVYTGAGLFLLVFWGFVAGERLTWLVGDLNGDMEMFFLSGVAMVTASTFVLIYNSDVFLALTSRLGNIFPSILPSLRTAIAYPMSNRFRMGMTLAMISLVVFALTVMSSMNLNYDKLFLKDDSRGGWDVQVMENSNNPLPSLTEALNQVQSPAASLIAAEGAMRVAGSDSATEVSQDGDGYDDYPVRGLSDGFVENGSIPLEKIAIGYETPEAVWRALQTEPDAAVIDGFTIRSGFGPNEFSISGIPEDEATYEAPTLRIRDSASGNSRSVRVIGVIDFGASSNFMGIFVGERVFADVFGEPEMSIHYAALTDPGDSRDVAKEIESSLAAAGVQADSLQAIAEENNALSRNFLYLMQAFMGLGLVVGIAAVGVIAFRTVVERRQQIGMLRAIGYKRSQVALSFLMENSFVTVLGVLAGTGLGLWLAYFLVTSDSFPGGGGIFYIPWTEIVVIGFLTIGASLLMTLIPSQQAASIPTAEALRYE